MIQRLLIVEDEPPARRKLQRLLQAQLPEVEIYTAEDTEEKKKYSSQYFRHLDRRAAVAVKIRVHLRVRRLTNQTGRLLPSHREAAAQPFCGA